MSLDPQLTDADYERFGQSLNLQRIERAPQGALYLNNDVTCEMEAISP